VASFFSETGAGSDLFLAHYLRSLGWRRVGDLGPKGLDQLRPHRHWGILLARTSQRWTAAKRHSATSSAHSSPGRHGATDRGHDRRPRLPTKSSSTRSGYPRTTSLATSTKAGAWAKVTLGNERVALSGERFLWGPRSHREGSGRPGALGRRSPFGLERDDLVKCWAHGEILRLLRLRLVSAALAGRDQGPEASVPQGPG